MPREIQIAYTLIDHLRTAQRALADAQEAVEAISGGAYDHPALAETASYPMDAISDAVGAVCSDIESVQAWLSLHEKDAA